MYLYPWRYAVSLYLYPWRYVVPLYLYSGGTTSRYTSTAGGIYAIPLNLYP